MMQRGDQTLVVALVQSDGRLVQHVHDAHQSGTDLRGQTDALGLSAGKRLRGARQRQIVQTDVIEESEARTDLLDDLTGDFRGRSIQTEVVDPFEAFLGGHVAHVGDGLVAHGDRQHLRAQPTAVACLAGHFAHVRFVILLHLVGVGLVMPAHQRADDAFEAGGVFAHASPAVTV